MHPAPSSGLPANEAGKLPLKPCTPRNSTCSLLLRLETVRSLPPSPVTSACGDRRVLLLRPSNWRRLPNHAAPSNRAAPRCSLHKRSVPLPPNHRLSTPHQQKSLIPHRLGRTLPCLELEGPSPYEAAFLLFPPRLGTLAANPVCSPASCSNQHRPQTEHTRTNPQRSCKAKENQTQLHLPTEPQCSLTTNLTTPHSQCSPPNHR